MSVSARAVRSPVVPTLRYRDLERAVSWLSTAFGFTQHDATYGPDGRMISAQLALGSGLVMLTAVGQSVFDDLMKQPDEIGGAETQSCYFIVADGDAHYATAVGNGATIVLELQAFETGGQGYVCRDVEGHLWSFGTYDPWMAATHRSKGLLGRMLSGPGAGKLLSHPSLTTLHERTRDFAPSKRGALAAAAAIVLIAAGAGAAMNWQADAPLPDTTHTTGASMIQLFKERGSRLDAERRIQAANTSLAVLTREKEKAETDLIKIQEELAHVAGAKEATERSIQDTKKSAERLNEQVNRLALAKEMAERHARVSIAKSLRDRQSRDRNRRRANELLAQLTAERQAREKSEKAATELRAELERETAVADSADKDRLKILEMLDDERKERAKAEDSLQQRTQELQREQEARRTAEAATNAAPSAAEAGTFSPPRPAKRPAKNKRNE